MIKDLRNVVDLDRPGCSDRPQRKVVVLASLVAFPKIADRLDEAPSISRQVTYHVVAQHQVWNPAGFEIGVSPPSAGVDLIFVRIDNIHLGLRIDGYGQMVKRMSRQYVVMIHQRNEGSGCDRKRRIRSGRYVAVAVAPYDPDTGVGIRFGMADCADMRRGRRVVGNTQLPIRIELVADRGDRLLEQVSRRLESRHVD